jgi:exodeoxyribonuclease VII small subunit
MTATDNQDQSQRFEDQLERLEEIVTSLEDETVGLERALELFESGMELAKQCRARLEEVEQRVHTLLETEEDDEPATEPLDGDDDPDPGAEANW